MPEPRDPMVELRHGDEWPKIPTTNKFDKWREWCGYLTYAEFDCIELYVTQHIGSATDLATHLQQRAEWAQKNVRRMVGSGLLIGNLDHYHPSSKAMELYHDTKLFILMHETGELMSTIVIGDIHARWDQFKELMRGCGVLDADDNRMAGFRIVQLGDAVSLGYGEQETSFYRWFMEDFMTESDSALIGNHELPAIIKNGRVEFHGWQDRDLVCAQLVHDYYRQGRLKLATHHEDWLLTHAGLIHHQLKKLDCHVKPVAKEIAATLDTMWYEYEEEGFDGDIDWKYDPLFGVDPVYGGVTWVRPEGFDEYDSDLRQMFGHSPIGPRWIEDGKLLLLDTSAGANLRNHLEFGRRPSQNVFGGVACAVFEYDHPEPVIRVVEADPG